MRRSRRCRASSASRTRRSTSRATPSWRRATASGCRWSRSTASAPSSTTSTRRRCAASSPPTEDAACRATSRGLSPGPGRRPAGVTSATLVTTGRQFRAFGHNARDVAIPGTRRRPRTPHRGRCSPSFALSAGADAGEEDGQGADLLPGDRRLHQHQRHPDPPRSLELRQVRQAGRRLLDRVAARRDPQDPAHAGPAQHRPRRRRPPRPGDRELADLRRARHQHRRRLRRRRFRRSATSSAGPRSRTSAA